MKEVIKEKIGITKCILLVATSSPNTIKAL